LRGFSRNYIPILFAGNDGLMGKEVLVTIKEVTGVLAFGKQQRA